MSNVKSRFKEITLPNSPEDLTKYQRILDVLIQNPEFTYDEIKLSTGLSIQYISKCLSAFILNGWIENVGSFRKPNWKIHKKHLVFCDECKESIAPGIDGGYIKKSYVSFKSAWIHNRCLNEYLSKVGCKK